jgi:hypothetical protein
MFRRTMTMVWRNRVREIKEEKNRNRSNSSETFRAREEGCLLWCLYNARGVDRTHVLASSRQNRVHACAKRTADEHLHENTTGWEKWCDFALACHTKTRMQRANYCTRSVVVDQWLSSSAKYIFRLTHYKLDFLTFVIKTLPRPNLWFF